MKHLTDDQLSALIDDALLAPERAACDTHLAGCEACRARVAELSALDESLGRALEHDPGDAYFADFADRVNTRIVASGQRPSAPEPEPMVAGPAKRSPWQWLFTPRGLALAGSTAALLAVAGVAWMRFGRHDDVASALRDEAPSPVGAALREQSMPAIDSSAQSVPFTSPAPETRDAMVHAPTPSGVADGAPAEPAPSPATGTAPPTSALRAREVRKNASGTEVPVRSQPVAGAPGSGSRLDERERQSAPVAKTPIAQMKRRAVAPATEEAAKQKLEAAAPAAPTQSLGAAAPPRVLDTSSRRAKSDSPTPTAVAPEGSSGTVQRGGRQAEVKLAPLIATRELESPCGTVHDTRGQPVAAAQVIAHGQGMRTTKSGPDGRFCLSVLRVGDTLSVLRIGYEPMRVVVGPSTSLALRLEPVGTLDPEAGGKLLAKGQESALRDRQSGFSFTAPSRAPAPDLYATQSAAVRQALVVAREADETARRERTAAAYEKAFERWDNLAGRISGPASFDARIQAMGALRLANQLEPTLYRRSVLRSRLIVFLALAPDSLPEHDTAQRWKAELERAPRSTYR